MCLDEKGHSNGPLLLQAVKNESELEGMREAHLRDAVALAKFLSGIEAQVRIAHSRRHENF